MVHWNKKKARLGTDQARPWKWKSKQALLNEIKEIFFYFFFYFDSRYLFRILSLFFILFSINYRNRIAEKSCIHLCLYNRIQKAIKNKFYKLYFLEYIESLYLYLLFYLLYRISLPLFI